MVFELYFFYAGCNEWNRSLLCFYPQTKYSFKYYFQTVHIWWTAQIQTPPDQTSKTFFRLHENNGELILIYLFIFFNSEVA